MAKKTVKHKDTPPKGEVVQAKVSNESTIELSAVVARSIGIQTILMEEARLRRDPDADTADPAIRFKVDFTLISTAINSAGTQIVSRLKYQVRSHYDDSPLSDESKVFIECSFVAIYTCTNSDGIEKPHLEAFSRLNTTFHVWPYLREFVQNASYRMSLKPIVLPIYRMES